MLTARLELLRLEPGSWVLDLGCGEGRHTHGIHMLEGVNVIGIDLDEESLQKAARGLTILPTSPGSTTGIVRSNAVKLPFADAVFDAVICSEVFEHLPDYHAALREINRVLKPEGRLCLTVPRRWPERICWRLAPPPDGYPLQPGGHIRIFDEMELRYATEQYGFRSRKRHHAHGLHTPFWWLKCMFWSRRDDHPIVKAYHRLLVWDILKQPRLTKVLDIILTPFIGKSLVLYFVKEAKP